MRTVNWQKPWIKYTSLFFVLLIMTLLFIFSNQAHEVSEQSSEPLAKVVEKTGVADDSKPATVIKKIISPIIHTDDYLPPEQQAQQIARKLGHILIFAALGFWLRIGLESWFADGKPEKKKHFFAWALLLGTAYGAFDETHQLMVPGRSAEIHDVIVDALGVLLGIAVAAGFKRILEKRNEKDRPSVSV